MVQGRDVAFALGKSLEAYLHLAPEERLASSDAFIRAFALLDRGVTREQIDACTPQDEPSPLWRAFLELRTGVAG